MSKVQRPTSVKHNLRLRFSVSVRFVFRPLFSPTLFLGLLLAFAVPQSFAKRTERLINSWRPTDYKVSLTFNDKLTELTSATTEITILSLRDSLARVDLDFGDLAIDSVTVNNRAAPYERASGLLNVTLPQAMRKGTSCVIAVKYHGKPKDGLILALDKTGKPSAVGDNWPNRVHHWIPSLDHPSAKATVSFSVTAPAGNTVVANGALSRVENSSASTKTWSYSEGVPIPPYCMIVAVGDFAQIEGPTRDVTPLTYYVPHSYRAFAPQGFAPAGPSLKFFSQTVAPYPYEKLALIVGATRFGGMENSNAIVFSPGSFESGMAEPLSAVYKIHEDLVTLVAHEIAHQWFGDSVTAATWSDLWLSEGFADYFAGLFIQRYEGEAAFQRYMKTEAERYLNFAQQRRIPIHDTETEDLFRLLNANSYQKGAWVLHMLRSELGDEKFFRGIRRYYELHRNSTASSEDLRAAFEHVSGRKLQDFFARWIYGAGHPSYELSWSWNNRTRKVKLVLRQLQNEPAFPNAVPVEILTGRGTQRISLRPTSKQTTQELKLDQAPSAVTLDPLDTILKEARVDKSK